MLLPLIYLVRAETLESLSHTFLLSHWHYALFACLINLFLMTLSRAKRFSVLIYHAIPEEEHKTTLFDLVSVMSAARAINLIFPARSGDILKAIQLNRKFGYHPETIVAVVLIESIFDTISLAFLAFLTILFKLTTPKLNLLLYPLIAIGTISVLFIAALYKTSLPNNKLQFKQCQISPRSSDGSNKNWMLGRWGRLKVKALNVAYSIHIANTPKVWFKTLGWTLATDLLDVIMIGLCLKATNIQISIPNWFLILSVINVAILIPVPGNLGTLETGAILILSALGVSQGDALGFALLYHAAHIVPIILLGSLSLYVESQFS